jgi:glutathione S-transferase
LGPAALFSRTMSYTLIGSARSPYVRICRMLLIQNNIDFNFRLLNFVDDPKDAATLASVTPINRVPLLLDGDQKIFDSRVIVNYLMQKHGWKRLSLDEENYVSASYSCLEAGVALFLLRRDGLDTESPGFYFSRQRARIPANLKYLAPWVSELDPSRPGDWNYPAMSLFSFLFWAEARDLLKISDYPEHAAFQARFENACGVAATGFEESGR